MTIAEQYRRLRVQVAHIRALGGYTALVKAQTKLVDTLPENHPDQVAEKAKLAWLAVELRKLGVVDKFPWGVGGIGGKP